jgi:N-methylhydantoinase A
LSWRVGIDIGGAFTDLIAINDETGETKWVKVESTPKDYSEGVIESIIKSKLDLRDAKHVVHGQTIVINTIITRSGSKVGLITTKGFDILEIGRANRRDLFNLKYRKPQQFVPRYLTEWVKERIMVDGTILIPLDENEVIKATENLIQKGCESIAISFINSYVNPIHEQKAGKIVKDTLEKMGRKALITLGHELSREWREYERTSTAVLNAYTQPQLDAYISILEETFRRMNFKGTFYVMLAAAGMATSEFAKKYPIFTVEGGPIAGIVGGTFLAEFLGYKDIIVLDGGSTTTKAGLVRNLLPRITTEYYIGRDRFNPGHPVKVPVVEVIEVGNGGTSIAWVDEVGALKVGPKAAGAYPGPACYGKGGIEPTLTDAYVVTGYLNPNYLLGGALKVYREKAEEALKKLADQFETSIEDVADAIIRIANDQAAHVIRLVSVQRGFDPRDFTLIAHGGSGPMFAPFIASELQIPKIIIPAIPAGVFNAWGMLVSDIRHDVVHTHVMKLTNKVEDAETIKNIYHALEKQLFDTFTMEKINLDQVVIIRYADMRYYGQEHTIKIPVMPGEIGVKEVEGMEAEFIKSHEREYGFVLKDNPVEMVNLHVVGISRVKKPSLKELTNHGKKVDEALKEEREVYLGRTQGFRNIPIYSKDLLPIEKVFNGPAIIEENTATVVVTENLKAKMDKFGNIIISIR